MATTNRHSDVIDETGSTIHDAVSAVREAAHDKIEQARDKTRELKKSFDTKVREQPMKSVLLALGIGAGVGVLVAYLVRRR